jgi:hypothetical protein
VRRLVHDGAPVDLVYNPDLRNNYFKHGQDLFKDEAIIPQDHFIEANLTDTESPKLILWEGKLEVTI